MDGGREYMLCHLYEYFRGYASSIEPDAWCTLAEKEARMSDDDEPAPRRPMTKCEVLAWFFGKSRFTTDARPDRCAKCPAHVTAHAAEYLGRLNGGK